MAILNPPNRVGEQGEPMAPMTATRRAAIKMALGQRQMAGMATAVMAMAVARAGVVVVVVTIPSPV